MYKNQGDVFSVTKQFVAQIDIRDASSWLLARLS